MVRAQAKPSHGSDAFSRSPGKNLGLDGGWGRKAPGNQNEARGSYRVALVRKGRLKRPDNCARDGSLGPRLQARVYRQPGPAQAGCA